MITIIIRNNLTRCQSFEIELKEEEFIKTFWTGFFEYQVLQYESGQDVLLVGLRDCILKEMNETTLYKKETQPNIRFITIGENTKISDFNPNFKWENVRQIKHEENLIKVIFA